MVMILTPFLSYLIAKLPLQPSFAIVDFILPDFLKNMLLYFFYFYFFLCQTAAFIFFPPTPMRATPGLHLYLIRVWGEGSTVGMGTSIPGFPMCCEYFLAPEHVGIAISVALCEQEYVFSFHYYAISFC